MLTMNGIQDRCIQECSTSFAVARVQKVKSQSIYLDVLLLAVY